MVYRGVALGLYDVLAMRERYIYVACLRWRHYYYNYNYCYNSFVYPDLTIESIEFEFWDVPHVVSFLLKKSTGMTLNSW